jgi:predicted nucleic acid-binding protein
LPVAAALRAYFRARLSADEADRAVAALMRVVLMAEDPIEPEALLRDPSDDYLIALAKAAGAEAIVTGDKDLLEHAGLEPRAISPREACELLGLV